MNNQEKTTPENPSSRRKFVWGMGIFAAVTTIASATGLPLFTRKSAKTEGKRNTVKMLTEDGRLVEIDESLITSQRKKATNADVQHWIKK